MAKQKQINLRVLLLVTGLFFTVLSAGQACFAPYISIYLRQLGLTASQVGLILGCKSLLVACTASCLGSIFVRLKLARVLLLLATVLYLGGVLAFVSIPSTDDVDVGEYCVGLGNKSGSYESAPFGGKLEESGSENGHGSPEVTPTTITAHMDGLQTTVQTEQLVTERVNRTKVTESTGDDRRSSTPSTTRTNPSPHTWIESHTGREDGPVQTGSVQNPEADDYMDDDAASEGRSVQDVPQPPGRRFGPGRQWSRNRKPFYHRKLPPAPTVSGKPTLGQRGQGRYQSPQQNSGWRWSGQSLGDYGDYGSWNLGQDQLSIGDDGNEYLRDNILNWILRKGRQETVANGHSGRGRVLREVKLPRSIREGNGSDVVSTDARNGESTVENEKSSRSATVWIALLIVVLSAVCGGPIEHMCDNALYHQLDSIDELDKYKRPTLCVMPVFAVAGLISAIVVDKTPCVRSRDGSHMLIHFYMGAACIGVTFLVGLIVPVCHKAKSRLEGKFFKSMKLFCGDSHTAVMCSTLVVIAMISSCSDAFLFWLIQDMQGSETTMGASLAVAYMTELPMSAAFTPWLVQKIGNIWLLALGSACLGVQNLYYSVLWTPWAVVPIQLFSALSRAAIRGCVLAYLSEVSPPGMGRTVQVTVVALEQGLGHGVGTVGWGFLLMALDVKLTFAIAAALALLWAFGLIVCACRLPTKKRFLYAKLLQSDMEMDMNEVGLGSGSDDDDDEEKEFLKESGKMDVE